MDLTNKKVMVLNLPHIRDKGKVVQIYIAVPQSLNIDSNTPITDLPGEHKLIIYNAYRNFLYLENLRSKQ